MRRRAHVVAARVATILAVMPFAAAWAAPTPEQLMARLLVAGDLADACPDFAARRWGPTQQEFIREGVNRIVLERSATMAELFAVTRDVSHEEMQRLKRAEMRRRGVDLDNRQEVCFFALQIVGGRDEIGRYLKRR
jgi:hypothetical protein